MCAVAVWRVESRDGRAGRGKGPRSLCCPVCADVRAVGALVASSSDEQTERSSVCMRVVSLRRSGVDGWAVRLAAIAEQPLPKARPRFFLGKIFIRQTINYASTE